MPRGDSYDYIIVGAGSAGCVLANRLSADPSVKVLLLEAGKNDRHLWLKIPLKFRDLMTDMRFNWGYDSEPEPQLGNRSIYIPRGRVLGGSSTINGMVYARGHSSDFDHWRQLGLAGWSYADVLPYFKRSEGHVDGDSAYHGGDGPLTVSKGDGDSGAHRAYRDAARAAGLPVSDDLNGKDEEGIGQPAYTIRNNRRASTSRVFLAPVLKRRNLTLIMDAHVNHVVFEGQRAVGIDYRVGSGAPVVARAEREVILSGGAYNSPQTLMLSGIGDADELGRHGIAPLHHSPAVGKNLQDHVHTGVGYASTNSDTFDKYLRADRLALSAIQWMLFSKGHLGTLPLGAIGFVRSRPDIERPDIELMLTKVSPEARVWFPGIRKPIGGFLGCRTLLLHPESRGEVKLRSANPADKPRIFNNFFQAEKDMTTLRDGVKLARRLYASEPLRSMIGEEMFPGKAIRTDDEIDAYIRETANLMYHPVGTCRMGSDLEAVVDGELKVNGVQGLRVVDASVMPTLPGGHTNAPTIMIAEKAADMILGRKAPPPAEV